MTEQTANSSSSHHATKLTAGIAIAGIAIAILLLAGGVRFATQIRANMLAAQGYEALMRGDFEEGLRLNKAALRLDQHAPEAWFNVGVAHMELDQLDEAIDAFTRANELAPQNIEFQRALAEGRGYRAYLDGDYEKSVRMYRDVIWLGEPESSHWHALGAALLRKGDFDEAIEAHEAALRIDPENPELISALGYVYSEVAYEAYLSEQYQRSAALYRKATAQLVDDAETWFNLCTALYALREYDHALDAARQAQRLHPQNPTYSHMVRRIEREREASRSGSDESPE